MLRILRMLDDVRLEDYSEDELRRLSCMGEKRALRNMRKMDGLENSFLEFSDDSSEGEDESESEGGGEAEEVEDIEEIDDDYEEGDMDHDSDDSLD